MPTVIPARQADRAGSIPSAGPVPCPRSPPADEALGWPLPSAPGSQHPLGRMGEQEQVTGQLPGCGQQTHAG